MLTLSYCLRFSYRTTQVVVAIILVVSVVMCEFHGLMGDEVRPHGLQQRVPWTTSRVQGSPEPPSPYRTERVFPQLQFVNPVCLTNSPGTQRLFVAELDGKLFSFRNEPSVAAPDLFFDIKAAVPSCDRVYGLTFHPDFAENRYCYVCYTVGQNVEDGTRVSRFLVSKTDPPRVDPDTELPLLTWRSGGHNGGCLKFGPDGYFYISTGDAGPAFPPDPLNSGQDVSNLLSCILRIDVDHADAGRPYSIPPDNPFADFEGARGEIWCYGLRNPWRMSFDAVTGELWVGDVGWELWELVYRVERGANYGWSLVEGPQPVHRERTRGPTPIIEPTAIHSHIEARSVTGGMVYRGSRLTALEGAYIYGDYVTGKLWALRHDGRQVTALDEIADTPLAIICFGADHQGELYIVGYDGTIHRLEENSAAAVNEQFPRSLSETGLFTSVPDHAVAPGVIPYSIIAEPWMDGALAERFIALPGESRLEIEQDNNAQVGRIRGNWQFPSDSVLMKTMLLELRPGDAASRHRLETQILHYDQDTWRGYTYIWNDEQTDAVLAPDQASERSFEITDPETPGGKRQQTWHFASRTECLLCHTTRGGSIYGFVPSQLDREHDYGEVSDNQLRTLKHIGLFEELAKDPSRRIVSPYDETADLEARARAYMHVNCSHCHRRGGGGTAAMDVQHHLSLEKTDLLEARPTQGTFGIHGAEVLAAGDPYRSVLLYRMLKLGRGRMPYIGSSVVDQRGARLIHDWAASLAPGDADSRRGQQHELIVELAAALEGSRAETLSALLSTTSGALMLLRAIDDGKLDRGVETEAIDLAAQHADIQIRDLFARFLPEEQRPQRLGTVIDADAILKLSGNAEQGRELFLSEAGVQCKNCHQIRGQGRGLGPDLSEIGKKYTRAQLLESVLDPSRTIDPKYVTHLVETVDGRVLTGLLVERDDAALTLKDAQANDVRIEVTAIEFTAPQQKSLMPELLLQDLTAQQVADLLEYLGSLR